MESTPNEWMLAHHISEPVVILQVRAHYNITFILIGKMRIDIHKQFIRNQDSILKIKNMQKMYDIHLAGPSTYNSRIPNFN